MNILVPIQNIELIEKNDFRTIGFHRDFDDTMHVGIHTALSVKDFLDRVVIRSKIKVADCLHTSVTKVDSDFYHVECTALVQLNFETKHRFTMRYNGIHYNVVLLLLLDKNSALDIAWSEMPEYKANLFWQLNSLLHLSNITHMSKEILIRTMEYISENLTSEV